MGLWSWRWCLDCARALGPSPGEGTQEPLPGRRPERDSVGSMTHSTVMSVGPWAGCPGLQQAELGTGGADAAGGVTPAVRPLGQVRRLA